jgi:hypothetical protein
MRFNISAVASLAEFVLFQALSPAPVQSKLSSFAAAAQSEVVAELKENLNPDISRMPT